MIKRVFFLLLSVGVIISLARFTHSQTRGFRLSKIENNLYPIKSWTPDEDNGEITPWFYQSYSFLDRGLQSFVFVSEDQQYVVKIFNNRYQSAMSRFSFLSKIPFLTHWARNKYHYYKNKLIRTFTSYELAYQHLREETSLLYTHLNSTECLPHSFTIKDCLNISHTLDLNQYGFIVQKKCDLFYPTLAAYIERNEIHLAKEAINQLVELFLYKYKNGIADNDPLIRTNYGFLNEQLVQIDVGPLSLDPSLMDPEKYRSELIRTTRSLKHWLAPRSPELVDYLEQKCAL